MPPWKRHQFKGRHCEGCAFDCFVGPKILANKMISPKENSKSWKLWYLFCCDCRCGCFVFIFLFFSFPLLWGSCEHIREGRTFDWDNWTWAFHNSMFSMRSKWSPCDTWSLFIISGEKITHICFKDLPHVCLDQSVYHPFVPVVHESLTTSCDQTSLLHQKWAEPRMVHCACCILSSAKPPSILKTIFQAGKQCGCLQGFAVKLEHQRADGISHLWR